MANFKKISDDDFPRGSGSRIKRSEDWFQILDQMDRMKPGDKGEFNFPNRRPSSAHKFRSLLVAELMRKKKHHEWEILSANSSEVQGYQALFLRRL